MKIARNAKCPCGSGKKYKQCCLQKDLEKAREAQQADAPFEENPAPAIPTPKIFFIGLGILALVALIFVFPLGLRPVGMAIFVLGLVSLILYCAFRNPPTIRKRTGDGGNIDFGNRP